MSDAFWKILALKGIKGGGDTPTQEKTVALDMANGNQIINPDDGKTMTQATVLKPATMAAENIKSGVDIGGVVGSLEGKLPEEEKSVTITENGTTEVNATDGKAMTKVVVTTNVAIDNKVGQIVDGSITELTAGDLEGATKLRDSIFSQYSSLTKVAIPSSVISIGNEAFYNCRSLTNITIGNGVTSIGGAALRIGGGANEVIITMLPTTPPTIASNTFTAEYLNKIIVPKGTSETYKAATNWSAFADYIEEATE